MSGDDRSDGERIRRRRRRERTPAAGGERLASAKGRKESSRHWLQRQLRDPYVAEAKRLGYRSRAAFKLIEIDDKYKLLKPGMRVVDLGAAPGGWCQVARERVGEHGRVVGLDLLEIEPIAGVELFQGDMNDPATPERLRACLGGPADAVLSDMAPNATGHKRTDQLRVLAVVEAALDFAEEVLAPGGTFLAKTLQSGGTGELATRLKRAFRQVRYVKPPASRSASAETYVLATGYRGRAAGAGEGRGASA